MKAHFERAIANVVDHGDTDIFPFPLENHIFRDQKDRTVALLTEIHKDFDNFLFRFPPINESALTPVGYTGFRWATQLDPVWNAYLLSLVDSLAEDIEAARLPVSKKTVFSYRYEAKPAGSNLFRMDIGWTEFQQHSLMLAKKKRHKYVLICDIADFYSRVYHHRLENALDQLPSRSNSAHRILKILQSVSNNNSYGLPVGGPGARLLAELVLNRVDRLLNTEGIDFCRFADDYHIFADSLEAAYQRLVFLTEKLLRNEGLSLQKSKTRIMTASEFIASADSPSESPAKISDASEVQQFMRIPLRYDPYSPTASDDYDALREEVGRFDILGMLSKELVKSRIHTSLTRKLIAAVKFLGPKAKADTARTLVDNSFILAPVFPQVLICLHDIFDELNDDARQYVCSAVRDLIRQRTHVMQVTLNFCFALRVLSKQQSEENVQLCAALFGKTTSAIARRDIILILASFKAAYWISDLRNSFRSLGAWERRAFIVASYMLGDEGKHWRNHVKVELTPIEVLFRDWSAVRFGNNNWSLPL